MEIYLSHNDIYAHKLLQRYNSYKYKFSKFTRYNFLWGYKKYASHFPGKKMVIIYQKVYADIKNRVIVSYILCKK